MDPVSDSCVEGKELYVFGLIVEGKTQPKESYLIMKDDTMVLT